MDNSKQTVKKEKTTEKTENNKDFKSYWNEIIRALIITK